MPCRLAVDPSRFRLKPENPISGFARSAAHMGIAPDRRKNAPQQRDRPMFGATRLRIDRKRPMTGKQRKPRQEPHTSPLRRSQCDVTLSVRRHWAAPPPPTPPPPPPGFKSASPQLLCALLIHAVFAKTPPQKVFPPMGGRGKKGQKRQPSCPSAR